MVPPRLGATGPRSRSLWDRRAGEGDHLAITTAGYPAAMAAYGWIDEVVKAES